jgi:hypothetical protein
MSVPLSCTKFFFCFVGLVLSPSDQISRRKWGWRPWSFPCCTSATRRQQDRKRQREEQERGHVRAFQEEDDEHDGQKVLRRRRRLGDAAAGSRFRGPRALLPRRWCPAGAVAGLHEQLPLGSHWLARNVAPAASFASPPGRPLLLWSWSPPRRREGEEEKPRHAAM